MPYEKVKRQKSPPSVDLQRNTILFTQAIVKYGEDELDSPGAGLGTAFLIT
ncbi:hypothetical protein [Bacillus niameyensis]|uniref:hypothetical protein n=1 Tax=Bacillus niameyensis TaxID=1522308 RepID=UPI001E348B33|nr:hypothetical protein [Bacillus niameyensis]